MSKFKPGDKARVKYVRSGFCEWWKPGVEVIVLSIIPDMTFDGDPYDCVVQCPNGQIACPLFEQLEPIVDLGNWEEIEDSIGWSPTKEVEYCD